METPRNVPLLAAAIGALAGFRSMSALAAAAHAIAASPGAGGNAALTLMASNAGLSVLDTLAAGEMVADKTPSIPNRIAPAPFLGRTVMGGVGAAALAVHLGERPGPWAAAGAAAAAITTVLSFQLRRRSSRSLSNAGAGFMEDLVVVGSGWILSQMVAARHEAAVRARTPVPAAP